MTFVEDQMDFIERLLDREGLDPAVAESCAAQLAAIRRRHSDPILRLGVIGEFSSGKSAFINALLGDELLKTDLVVTTTVPTEVVAGERLELELRRQGSDDWLPTAGEDVRAALTRLTTDPSATAELTAVRIRHPAALLQAGVALIDTPGLNGSDEGHTAATLGVLADRADGCVVVLRGGQALPLTLSRFLQRDDVRPLLRHAVFVVTRMAAVRPEQQDELLESIRETLRSTLELDSPMVMPCSVGVVLDHLADPESVSAWDLPWVERFAALRRELAERLERDRASIVSERLLSLLDTLMVQLSEHLRERERELSASRASLSKARAPKLASFSQKERARVHKELERAAAHARQRAQWSAAERRQEAVEASEALLEAATDRGGLRGAADEAEEVVRAALVAYAGDVDALAHGLRDATASAVASFDERFRAAYSHLTELGAPPRRERGRTLSRLDLSQNVGSVALEQLSVSARPNDTGAAMGGIAAGVVAAAFIPVIGPLVGLGAWLLGRTGLDEIRANCLEALEEAAEEVFDDASAVADKHLAKAAKSARARVDRHIDRNLAVFEGAIAELVTRGVVEARRLSALSASTKRDLASLEQRHEALTVRRAPTMA